MEATFPCIDAEREPTEEEKDGDDFAVWGRECVANGRHAVIVGALPNDFFLVMLIRRDDPDMQYVIEDMREVFRAAFGREPEVDTEVADVEVWTSPKTSREIAIAVARELVEVDRRDRDPDVECAYGIMTC